MEPGYGGMQSLWSGLRFRSSLSPSSLVGRASDQHFRRFTWKSTMTIYLGRVVVKGHTAYPRAIESPGRGMGLTRSDCTNPRDIQRKGSFAARPSLAGVLS